MIRHLVAGALYRAVLHAQARSSLRREADPFVFNHAMENLLRVLEDPA